MVAVQQQLTFEPQHSRYRTSTSYSIIGVPHLRVRTCEQPTVVEIFRLRRDHTYLTYELQGRAGGTIP